MSSSRSFGGIRGPVFRCFLEQARCPFSETAETAILRLSKRDLDRADARAVQGETFGDDATELENYRSVGRALEFLKSKARRSLAKAG